MMKTLRRDRHIRNQLVVCPVIRKIDLCRHWRRDMFAPLAAGDFRLTQRQSTYAQHHAKCGDGATPGIAFFQDVRA